MTIYYLPLLNHYRRPSSLLCHYLTNPVFHKLLIGSLDFLLPPVLLEPAGPKLSVYFQPLFL
ncbi:unnamed protein product [Meloidogyne enterolobii]|uniref:Uncharacterized protein n=1 Tax=Meloidogyne enterolobii TaxID=390850 RepID=A0ACB0YXA9_MELEN